MTFQSESLCPYIFDQMCDNGGFFLNEHFFLNLCIVYNQYCFKSWCHINIPRYIICTWSAWC